MIKHNIAFWQIIPDLSIKSIPNSHMAIGKKNKF